MNRSVVFIINCEINMTNPLEGLPTSERVSSYSCCCINDVVPDSIMSGYSFKSGSFTMSRPNYGRMRHR